MSEFKKETSLNYKRTIHRIEQELPSFCKTYFIGKEASLSASSAASYAYEFFAFFSYLCKNNAYFSKKGIKNITLEDLALLKTEDIEEYLHELRFHSSEGDSHTKESSNKESTITKNLSAISSLYTFFIKRGHLSFNPTAAIERQKKQIRKPVVLDHTEQKKLFETIDFGSGMSERQQKFLEKNQSRDRAIFQVLLDTGVRVSELVGIDINDINFDEHYFTVHRKRNKIEDIYFSDYTQAVLLDYLSVRGNYHPPEAENALFLSSMGSSPGRRISIRSVQLLTKKYITSSCPDRAAQITPHKMRSTFGTEMLAVTNDLELVSELLGHDSLNTTKIYAQYNDKKKQQVRNVFTDHSE